MTAVPEALTIAVLSPRAQITLLRLCTLAQQTAQQYGGAIAVGSTEGKGSIFTLRLPLR